MPNRLRKADEDAIDNPVATTARSWQPVQPIRANAGLLALIAALNASEIAYCFWKGSHRLAAALTGESDLDLLVSRRQASSLLQVMATHGFKHWPDIAGRDHPAMMSFFGHDESSGAISHVHVHFGMVYGNSLLKAYRLPGEVEFIGRSSFHPVYPVRVLHPVDEALLLILHIQLETRRLDIVAASNWSALLDKNWRAFAELSGRVGEAELHDRAAEIFSSRLARDIAAEFASRRSVQSRGSLRRAIASELVAYRMYGPLETGLRTMARTVRFAANVVNRRNLQLPRPWGRRIPGGGLVIAFAGVDGSGKSTQVSGACDWLGRETDVLSMYFGTGDGRASLLLQPLKSLVPLISRFIKTKPRGASHGKISDRPPGLIYSLLFGVWATAVALEKRHKIISARRAANRGMIVIADRYPQNEIAEFNDGPLLYRLPHAPGWLHRFEFSVYALAHATPPDLVFKLQVGPEAVQAREPDMRPGLVTKRIAWLDELKFPGARVVLVDARLPLPQVTRIVRREIWNSL